jgi:hypothetical protein
MKELWQTPEFQEKMRLRNLKVAELRKANPAKFNRAASLMGCAVPSGAPVGPRPQLADRFIKIMKDKGELPDEKTFGERCSADVKSP